MRLDRRRWMLAALVILLGAVGAGVAIISCGPAPIDRILAPGTLLLPKTAPKLSNLLPESRGVIGVLLLGSDARPGEGIGRSDAIMLALISQKKHKMVLISFPRDAWVPISGRGRDKINSALPLGGPKSSVRTVRNYLGLPVSYYFEADFTTFPRVVNKLGGVPIYLDRSVFDRAARATLPRGGQELSGAEALALARARKTIPGGDFGRAANHQRIVAAAQREFLADAARADLGYYVRLLKKDLKTNMPALVALSTAQTLRRIKPEDVETIVLPGSAGSAGGASVVFLDQAGVRQIVKRVKAQLAIE